MKLTGEYRFYENGELVHQESNLITTNGKAMVVRYFAGSVQSLARTIAVGISDAAAAVGDISLGFEVARSDVTAIGADITNNKVIFKTKLPSSLVANIREVGTFSLPTNAEAGPYGSQTIFSMGSSEIWTPSTFTTTNTRVSQSLTFTPAASAVSSSDLSVSGMDLSGYSLANDQLILAYYNANTNAASVTVKIGTDSANYTAYTITNPAVGYAFASFTKGSGTVTGTPNWANINYIHIDVTANASGAAGVYVDSLRIEDRDTFSQTYALFSHSILATPVQKKSGVPMEIEYALGITV